MKVIELVNVPATTEERVVGRQCDLCGLKTDHAEWPHDEWRRNDTQVKIEVKLDQAHVWPGYGDGHKIEVDMCPECFMKKLVPWLREQGAQIEDEDYDWG